MKETQISLVLVDAKNQTLTDQIPKLNLEGRVHLLGDGVIFRAFSLR